MEVHRTFTEADAHVVLEYLWLSFINPH